MAFEILTDTDGTRFIELASWPTRNRRIVEDIDGATWVRVNVGEWIAADESVRICSSMRADGERFEAWRFDVDGQLLPGPVGLFESFEAAHAALR